MGHWNNKCILITGASSGIGAALAVVFARKGAQLVLGARNLEKLQVVADALPNEGKARCVCVATDVSVESECKALVDAGIERFGGIDAVINNAGISMRALFRDADLEVIRRLMDTNFWGTVYCTKYALPSILERGGHVVGMSSIAGYRGLPARTGYSASKFAMQGFLESLRTEHLYDGLHVLVVCPGFTNTAIRQASLTADGSAQGQSPREEGKMMTAEEVAEQTVLAMEKRQRTLVLTRQGKLTVFLNKWLPAWMDGMVYKHMAKEPDSPFGKHA
jgi:short-subunit dehydrogenase